MLQLSCLGVVRGCGGDVVKKENLNLEQLLLVVQVQRSFQQM
jgi:hypothetical protein